MDIEFHYWITGLIASHAGFPDDEARTIAYASQYVDDNDICYQIGDRKSGQTYGNFVSQTMNILQPKDNLMRIYPIFHFIPGDPAAKSARRRDGKMHILNTTPNSDNANELMDSAFKASPDTRLYRIGVATHAFADTWAHQNFVGWHDHFNSIDMKPGLIIGHADAEHHPDWVSHVWTDARLVDGEASNRNRFLEAARAIFGKYCSYLNTDVKEKWPALQDELITIMGQSYTGSLQRYEDARLKSYKQRLPWKDFDERAWFDEAIDTDVRGIRDNADGLLAEFTVLPDNYWWKDGSAKESTHWYRFQEAVKEHERLAIKLLSDLFRNMGYDLATV